MNAEFIIILFGDKNITRFDVATQKCFIIDDLLKCIM